MTWNGKSSIFKNAIQTTRLSKTLEAELTTKDRVFGEFWNSCSRAISRKLLFPPVTDFQDLEEISSNGYSNSSEQNLQYSIEENINPLRKNSQKILWKSLPSSLQDITVDESTRTRKIRFYPNQEQRIFFDKCFNVHRYFYNKAVQYNKTNSTTSNITIRNNLKIKDKELEYKWMKCVPYDTRDLAIKNFVGSFKSSLALKKKGHIKKFEMKYITKKDSNMCYMTKSTLTDITKNEKRRISICKRRIKSQLNFRKLIRKKTIVSDGEFPVIKDNAGRYYLCTILKIKNTPKNIKSNDELVALDPGVRTFQTYFSQKECGTIGDNINKDIRKINSRIDRLEALKPTLKAKTRYNLKRRCLLLRSKITNKVNDLHWKSASFLTQRYKVIFLPHFKVKQMCMKNKNKKVNREMCNLAHYKFKERLKYKAQLNNCQVIDCCESYTSKTCTKCGKLNNVGSNKIYKCESCECHIDRDLNGARNIFIRCLTKYYS